MWTVVFGPKVEFHLSNVDTKIRVLDFDAQITTTLKKYCPQKKCPESYGHFFCGHIPLGTLSLWTVDTWTVDTCHS